MYDRILAYPRLLKTGVALAQIALIYLSYKLLTGQLDEYLTVGSLAVSAFWLALTSLRLSTLLRTYFDHLSRLQVTVPCFTGAALSFLAICSTTQPAFMTLAALELLGWIAVYAGYRRNRANYLRQGHGPLPKETWINPEPDALQPGDLILTSGRMAGRLHDSVGHAELVIPGNSGRLHVLSSYMERGAQIRRLDAVITKLRAKEIHYIALRLRQPLSPEQLQCAPQIARKLFDLNVEWRNEVNRKRARFIKHLPLPARFKDWLVRKTQASGYDWSGLFIGTRAKNRWTCIGICVECLKQLKVQVGEYGTGMLGLGTGLLDPIQPVRLLADKSYRLIDLNDRAAYEAQEKQS